jgi:hypothetical protein
LGDVVSRTLRVQTVLFHTELAQVWRLLHGLDAAARMVLDAGLVSTVEWAIGDSTPSPLLAEGDTTGLDDDSRWLAAVTYDFFGKNLGSSGGQNRLSAGSDSALVMILNPDAYPSPTSLLELVRAIDEPGVAIAEARQIPMEHPKAFDSRSGDTSWASGACMLVERKAFDGVGGFDSEHFMLHCDDVDLSWRIRAAGGRVVIVPRATVFHDKRPAYDNPWPTPDAERHHAVLGRLMLATRWGRPEIVSETIAAVEAAGTEAARAGLAEFRRRERAGTVPTPLAGTSVAEFVDGEYAVHRY